MLGLELELHSFSKQLDGLFAPRMLEPYFQVQDSKQAPPVCLTTKTYIPSAPWNHLTSDSSRHLDIKCILALVHNNIWGCLLEAGVSNGKNPVLSVPLWFSSAPASLHLYKLHCILNTLRFFLNGCQKAHSRS